MFCSSANVKDMWKSIGSNKTDNCGLCPITIGPFSSELGDIGVCRFFVTLASMYALQKKSTLK